MELGLGLGLRLRLRLGPGSGLGIGLRIVGVPRRSARVQCIGISGRAKVKLIACPVHRHSSHDESDEVNPITCVGTCFLLVLERLFLQGFSGIFFFSVSSRNICFWFGNGFPVEIV